MIVPSFISARYTEMVSWVLGWITTKTVPGEAIRLT